MSAKLSEEMGNVQELCALPSHKGPRTPATAGDTRQLWWKANRPRITEENR